MVAIPSGGRSPGFSRYDSSFVFGCVVAVGRHRVVFVLEGQVAYLQAVSREVPLDGVVDGEGALEVLGAVLALVGTCVGVKVFVQKLTEIIGEGEDLEELGGPAERKTIELVPSLFQY